MNGTGLCSKPLYERKTILYTQYRGLFNLFQYRGGKIIGNIIISYIIWQRGSVQSVPNLEEWKIIKNVCIKGLF